MTSSIPNFALYGHHPATPWEASLHLERIPLRSRAHHWNIAPHTHQGLLQVLWIQSGSGQAEFEGQHLALVAPCLVWVPAGVVHAFRFEPDVDGPVLTASQGLLESLAQLAAPAVLPVLRHPRVQPVPAGHLPVLDTLFAALAHDALCQGPGQPSAGMGLLLAVVVELTRMAPWGQASSPKTAIQGRRVAQIQRFRSLLDAWCRERAPVARYAQTLGLSTGHLSRLCRELMGLSAQDAVNARLIHEARRELVYSSLSIKQIADALGFADEAYFGRLFKRHTGQRPTEFRAQARRSAEPTGPASAAAAQTLVPGGLADDGEHQRRQNDGRQR